VSAAERPAYLTEDHLTYLDALRRSGVTNMFGAGPYLVEKFLLTREQSHETLAYWMRMFGERTIRDEGERRGES